MVIEILQDLLENVEEGILRSNAKSLWDPKTGVMLGLVLDESLVILDQKVLFVLSTLERLLHIAYLLLQDL